MLLLGAAALLSSPWLPGSALAAEQPGTISKPLTAQAPPALTLEQAVALAYAHNPALRVAEQGMAIADGARTQAALLPNPALSVLREGAQRTNRTQTIQITQPLELGGKRAARIAVAEQDHALAAGEWQIKAAALRADVTAAYLAAVTAQQRAGLAQSAVELAHQASAAATRRVAAGKISPLDETRAQVAASTARLEMAQAQADLAGAKRRLAALWGGQVPVEQTLSEPAADGVVLPPLETLLAQLDHAPQIQQARAQITRGEAQVQFERAQRLPDAAVTFGSKRDQATGSTQAVAGLSIGLPLFNRNQGNVLSALRRVEQAASQLEADRLALAEAVSDAWQRAQVAQTCIDAMRTDMLPAAQRALDAAVTGFELGKFNFLDVLDAQRTLSQARARYLDALSERYRATADLQRLAALPEKRNTR
ncbi:TolC family protein [Pseudoduganella ginsengisoli]